MMNKLLLFLLMFVVPVTVFAQSKLLKGKVVSGVLPINEVLIVNINAEREVKTNQQGLFSINAKVDDTIMVTGPDVMSFRFTVKESSFYYEQIVQVILTSDYKLEELVIESDKGLTAEALGIVPKGQKKYTPQERKLYTAGDFKAYHLIGLLGGGLPVDPIINAINGRTKMLKKTVNIEKKESAIDVLNGMFTDEEVVNNFKIPKEYVQGFFFYCVEDFQFTEAIRANNDKLARFLMNDLAIKYVTLINEEIQDEK